MAEQQQVQEAIRPGSVARVPCGFTWVTPYPETTVSVRMTKEHFDIFSKTHCI